MKSPIHQRLGLALLAAALTGACAQTAAPAPSAAQAAPAASQPAAAADAPQSLKALLKQDSFRIHSRDWTRGEDGLNATIDIKRISPQVVSAHFTFARPLDPTKWGNPSLFNYFMMCFAPSYAQAQGAGHWAVGGDPKQEFDVYKSTEMTLDFAAINDPAELKRLGTLKDGDHAIQWATHMIGRSEDADSPFCRERYRFKGDH